MHYFDKKAVGFRIKELRRSKHMTQQQLAEQLFYSTERQLQRIENGEIICSIERLIEISQFFHTSTDYILFGDKEMTNLNIKSKTISVENDSVCVMFTLVGVHCSEKNE